MPQSKKKYNQGWYAVLKSYHHNSPLEDDEDYLTLNYQGFVPLLTKAVQEQQEEIDSQQKEIDALKSQLQMIMDMLDNDMSDKTDSKKDNDNKKPVKLSMATQK